jgi:protoporphyrinogen oxidase
MNKHPKKVLIIGAGPAGLTAAYKLLQQSQGYDVTILEESNAIGGISRTVLHNGNRMDIGGHRFFSKNADVNAMWQELMPLQGKPSLDDALLQRNISLSANGPDPEKEDCVMLTRNRVSRIYYKKHFFDYPVKINFNTIRNMGLFTTFIAGVSYLRSLLRKLPENSLENFYINRFGRKLYSMFFEGYTEKLWGRHPNVISADWGAQRVKGLSIVAVIKNIFSKIIPKGLRDSKKVETSLIEEFHYPKYGPGQLWEITADHIRKMGGRILFGHCVKKLNLQDGAIKEIVCVHNGDDIRFEGDLFISSMPIKDLVEGLNDVPQEVKTIAAGLPYRDFVTVGVLVDKLNLKNESKLKTLGNIIPDCWIYVQDTGVKLGRIQIFNNWSPYMVKDPQRSVWIGLEYFCSEGDSFWNKSPEEWKELGIAELIKIGVINKEDPVRDFHVEKVKKAYPAYFDTYSQIDQLIDHLNSIQNLYCVGRNGQHRYNNMDHSMATAFECVKNILSNQPASKDNIWNVNTEKEYHEEKKG